MTETCYAVAIIDVSMRANARFDLISLHEHEIEAIDYARHLSEQGERDGMLPDSQSIWTGTATPLERETAMELIDAKTWFRARDLVRSCRNMAKTVREQFAIAAEIQLALGHRYIISEPCWPARRWLIHLTHQRSKATANE